MSEYLKLVYGASQDYLRDFECELGEELYRKIHGWIRQRNLPLLASCSDLLDWNSHNSDQTRHVLQVEAFFKKNGLFSEAERCSTASRLSFERGEKLCRITNRRLDYYYAKPHRLDEDLSFWLSKAQGYIEKALGDFEIFFESIPERIKITAGATSTRSRKESIPVFKVSKHVVCTPACEPLLSALSKFYGYGTIKATHSLVNRVEEVPKNWKTYRTIACEPEGNLPFQLAFDQYGKERLRRFGINLSSQSLNQQMSLEGSLTGLLATVDLSMASDTIAFNTVALLLPAPWFQFLNRVRSPGYCGPYGIGSFAKFSSMGNGATFALETLIFAAACHAVGSKRFNVYGDDIVIETELVEDLHRFMHFLGFILNTDKSYSDGPFRESCGTHWYLGDLVTPFYVREWTDQKSVTCHNVNGLASVALPGGHLWKRLLRLTKSLALPKVPFNDDTMSGVFVDVQTAYAEKLFNRKHGFLRFKAYKAKAKKGKLHDTRALFMWYLQKYRMGPVRDIPRFDAPWYTPKEKYRNAIRFEGYSPVESSGYTMTSHKYVRKWVHWIPPVATIPSHLYWWADDLNRS